MEGAARLFRCAGERAGGATMTNYEDAVERGYDGPSPAEERRIKRYRQRLLAHPDCRDPDHPGCDQCEDFDCEIEGDE